MTDESTGEIEKKPTEKSYSELQGAYDYFNKSLFADTLPDCIITYQRVKNAYGYHSGRRWANSEGEKSDEIAMNPSFFATRKKIDTLSTLAHEMVHLWQEHFGKPGRGRYHNKEWAAKMKDIGLQPFNVDKPHRETGDRVSHSIVEDGRFEQVASLFIEGGFNITWLDRVVIRDNESDEENTENQDEEVEATIKVLELGEEDEDLIQKSTGGKRIKYSCPNGHYSVWGKKDINPMCGECKEYMEWEE